MIGEIRREDTSLEELVIYDLCIFGTSIFMSLIFFFGGKFIATQLGGWIDYFIFNVLTLADPIASMFGTATLALYALAVTFAIIYGLYGVINYGIRYLLTFYDVPQFRGNCKYKSFCYARPKWNNRVNKIVFGGAIVLGAVVGFIIPGFLQPPTGALAGSIMWIIFGVLTFSFPIYRLFVIIPDMLFFIYPPEQIETPASRRRRMILYIVSITIVAVWTTFVTIVIIYNNIKFNWAYALTLPYIIGYIIIGGSLAALIYLIIKYRRGGKME